MRRITSPSTLCVVAALGATLFATSAAQAQQPASKATAVQLFDEADRLMQQGKVSAACSKYAASMKLDPQLGALLHLADCYAKNGQLASAWGSFREAQEMAANRGDDRATFAKEQAALLEPRMSRLTVNVPEASNVPGLEVRVDGSPVTAGVWGIAAPIDPGSHGVEARAPGYETWSSSIDVTGETQSVRVEVPILTASAPPPPPPGNPGAPPLQVHLDDKGATLRTAGWVAIGVGAASLGLGAVFLVQKNSKLNDRSGICPGYTGCTAEQGREIKSLTNDASTASTVSTIGFVTGGVLAVGGLAAVLFAPKAQARAEAAWLLPAVGPQTLGLMGGAEW